MRKLSEGILLGLCLGMPVAAQDLAMEGGPFVGQGSIGSNEQLFYYDDQENWKHGYLKEMPNYHGFGAFRPYNYHHVFGQSTTAQGFGLSPVMPYSQQFWHRYEHMADLSQGNHEPVYPAIPPVPENDHFPRPINETSLPGQPRASYQPGAFSAPMHSGNPADHHAYPAAGPATGRGRGGENYSQLFSGPLQTQPVAPVQYQSATGAYGAPVGFQGMTRPALPAPHQMRPGQPY